MKHRRWLWALIAGIIGYGGSLLLLTLVERTDPNASIDSVSDALWYSIVTLSTVGYGDLYPVTPVGKVIGLMYVLLSVGALAFLVGCAVQLLTGKMLPRLRLWMQKKKRWYIFSQVNDASLVLAESILSESADRLILMPASQREQAPKQRGWEVYPDSIAETVNRKKDRCEIFQMDEASGSNYQSALALTELGCPVYCRTEQEPARCPENLTVFNRYACCAWDYWHSHPLEKSEQELVLIGNGRYAREWLERALLINVFGTARTVRYHVFGDWEDFQRNHPCLDTTLSLNGEKEGADSLHFHAQPWNGDGALLEQASRIILCADSEQENMDILRKLRRFFPLRGSVYIRAAHPIPGEQTFGTDRQIYSGENVMQARIGAMARMMHRIYQRSSQTPVADWKELSEFTRQSNIAAADHLPVKIRMLLENVPVGELTAENCRQAYQRFCDCTPQQREVYRSVEHLRWMRFHSLYNWRYGPARSNDARIHPMMLPYDQLSREEQEKDDYAWLLLEDVAKALERKTEER